MGHPCFHPIGILCTAIADSGALTLSGCSGQPLTTPEKGTLDGVAIGPGCGFLAVGHPFAGAAIGGIVGAGAEMAIGNSLQKSKSPHNPDEVGKARMGEVTKVARTPRSTRTVTKRSEIL